MADQKVTDLVLADTPLEGTKVLYLVQGGLDTQKTVQDVLDASSRVASVIPGENITADNTDPQNPIISSNGQSDPNQTIIGRGIAGDEFKYNEVVVCQTNTSYTLSDDDIYKTFTTDSSTDCEYDFSEVSEGFTCKFHVSGRNPARITLLSTSIFVGGVQYSSTIQSNSPSASITVRVLSNSLNCQNICGVWRAQ